MRLEASANYRNRKKVVAEEYISPRRIIGWLIGLQIINTAALGYVIWLLKGGF